MDAAHWCVPRAHGYSALLLALKRSAGEPDLCGPVARVVLDCTDSRWILMPAHVGINQAEKSHMQFFQYWVCGVGMRNRWSPARKIAHCSHSPSLESLACMRWRAIACLFALFDLQSNCGDSPSTVGKNGWRVS